MVKSNFKQIDLLRKRRGGSDLNDPYFIDTKKYIRKGVFYGLILIAISLIVGIPFIFRIKFLENQKVNLKVFSDEYDLLERNLDQESKQLKEISKFNNELKNSIINISSSSALFKEIALIIPKDIQLLELTSKGNSLVIKAKLSDKEYLGSLNSFLLNLNNSELVEFNDIDLKEIKVSDSSSKDKSFLAVINTKVATNYKKINKNYLTKLGSFGLFNRLTILKNIEENID